MKNYFLIICSLLIWSSYSVILKKTVINPVVFTFLTTSIGWIFILAYIKLKKIKISLANKKKFYIFFITILFLINSITFFYAYQLTSIPNAVFSHYLAPVFVSLLAPVLIKEKIEKITLFALFMAIIGMGFIFFPSGFEIILSKNDLLGISLGIISAFCYGLLIIMAKYLIKDMAYILLMFYQGLFTIMFGAISLPFLLKELHLNVNIIVLMIVVAFTHSFFAPILYLEGLKKVKAQYAGLLGYIEILGSLILGFIFFNEIPLLTTFIGGALIIISGGIVIIHGKQ
jgi:drug/metabolite transporter (DMT)-like permease